MAKRVTSGVICPRCGVPSAKAMVDPSRPVVYRCDDCGRRPFRQNSSSPGQEGRERQEGQVGVPPVVSASPSSSALPAPAP
jgi:DNA-directed RNA polymerase subunit RPC12/RpoP